jgi:cold shock CspA family protein
MRCWFPARGFGFAMLPTGASIFVHVSDADDVARAVPHPDEGDVLEFGVLDTPRGARAVHWRVVRRAGDA